MSLRPGSEFNVGGLALIIVEFCDEPNTGLAVVHYNTHEFTVPIAWLEPIRAAAEIRGAYGQLTREADRMAAGIIVAIHARLIDTRTPAGDAVLDYLDGDIWSREVAWNVLEGNPPPEDGPSEKASD